MPNKQLKATASLTQSFDVVIGFSISELGCRYSGFVKRN